MAAYKFTIQRGKVGLTISVNIDRTALTKGEVLILLDEIKQKIHAGPWPPL